MRNNILRKRLEAIKKSEKFYKRSHIAAPIQLHETSDSEDDEYNDIEDDEIIQVGDEEDAYTQLVEKEASYSESDDTINSSTEQ